jgi:hypothetical protein
LVNGANADATQVMANFNALLSCVNNASGQSTPRGYLSGLTLSTAGSSANFGIATGVATSSDETVSMKLSTSYAKSTGAWAVGSGTGALDSGSIASNTWYHVFLIERIDTGVVDVLVSLSATTPTLPANYTKQRRLGSMKTDGSSNWIKFIQDGDRFRWAAVVGDVAATNPGTAAVTRALTVPQGVRVAADVSATFQVGNNEPGSGAIYLSDLLQDDQAGGVAVATVAGYLAATSVTVYAAGAVASIMTDTTRQIRTRVGNSSANMTFYVTTHGWTDTRGR